MAIADLIQTSALPLNRPAQEFSFISSLSVVVLCLWV